MASELEINAMSPTDEQLKAFLALPDRPVVMVNLLKFKEGGGAVEYSKYGTGIQESLNKVGARLIFAGQAMACLIGNADWDAVALMEYPNPRALLDMVQSDEYQKAHAHRASGLEGQVNYAVMQNPD
jgi:uncharacterized protein (DUF1330 family)